jgi:hypothetical protein
MIDGSFGSGLFVWQFVDFFGVRHNIAGQFFVVHIVFSSHQLEPTDLFDVIDSQFLKDFEIYDPPSCWLRLGLDAPQETFSIPWPQGSA